MSPRAIVAKTYKLWIGGRFVRSEGGRVQPFLDPAGLAVANLARATRKDLRDAVAAARSAQPAWGRLGAFHRGQILFRVAEQLEDRRTLFEERLRAWHGYDRADAAAEAACAVDRALWYAGWADKYTQVLGSVNPVAQPFFNFTFPEPTGVVVILAPRAAPLLGLVSVLMPALVPGNAVVLAAESLIAVELAELLATSDVPGGVVNILTGPREDYAASAASHMEVDAMACFGGAAAETRALEEAAAGSVKRFSLRDDPPPAAWRDPSMQSLYAIEPYVELKTAWHPIGT
ncbi:MAG: aldehyde dehydrogenase family protein [Planctomycetota bacterium]